MSRTTRYRSRFHAALRAVAQRGILKSLAWSSLKVDIAGEENLTGLAGPYVVVSNHTSHVDATLIVCGIPLDVGRYLATGVAADYFFTRWHRKLFVALAFNAFPIERGNKRRGRSVAAQLLSEGTPILLFPEASRSRTGRMARFTPGAAGLSVKYAAPVVPVTVVGAFQAMPVGRSWPKPGRPPVRLVFGKPMEAEPGETPVQFTERISAHITDTFDAHAVEMGLPTQAELPVATRGGSPSPGLPGDDAGTAGVASGTQHDNDQGSTGQGSDDRDSTSQARTSQDSTSQDSTDGDPRDPHQGKDER
ncbi:lysophospholipid acyltransferase family protein [Microlunatus sp. Y2014]|uniref:lysophospholipid acyltransferase family protein n=1 Tax=Microlunatus sp. Y2014 TaxID=3418488 RepID=UPI003DA75E3B